MKIGILGGTFNPVHLGHMILAQSALEILRLDKIIFVPANIQPLKSSRWVPRGIDRLKMLRLALRGAKKFSISDLEIKRGGKSYTVETLDIMRRKFKGKSAELFFLAGSDAISDLGRWKNFDKIKKLAKFVVAARPGFCVKLIHKGIKFINIPQIDISSSDVRKRINTGKGVEYLLDKKVLAFINRKGLYK
jgi:nicotinate-nucleotide adenylyltransferase